MHEIYKTFEMIRKSNLEARKNNLYDKLLENAQALSDYIPQLIEILVTEENKYRKIEAEALNEEKMTSARAETVAKSSENYKEYIRAKLTLDWCYETINISKKLATSVGNEYNSQIK